jgi:hypothetical protein
MPKKGLKGSSDNSMINFYEHKDVKKLAMKYHNPHFADTQIDIPARIGVIVKVIKLHIEVLRHLRPYHCGI